MENTPSRRTLLLRCLQLPIGGSVLLGLTACGDDSGGTVVCANESTMTAAEKSLRATLGYVEASTDSAKTCADCDFFQATAASSGCGTCEIFSGKPVNPAGYCTSWSVDPKGET